MPLPVVAFVTVRLVLSVLVDPLAFSAPPAPLVWKDGAALHQILHPGPACLAARRMRISETMPPAPRDIQMTGSMVLPFASVVE